LANPTIQDGADDGQLITRCGRGDATAFRELVERHQGYAFALAFRILCDEDDAREAVQESFVRVWKHAGMYDTRSRFTTWFYRIVTRLAQDRLKSNIRRSRVITRLPADQDVPAGMPGADDEMTNRQLAERITGVADGLPPAQRMVFVLRDLEDLSIREIAERLGMSAGSVKANLCYARARVRSVINSWEKQGGRES
jgi:RNA polymerase sigma-70 factor (ECF subfamily)